MDSYNGINVGDTVVVTKNDPMDERCGTPISGRWVVGEEFVVGRISKMFDWVFFHNKLNDKQNIDSKRVSGVPKNS